MLIYRLSVLNETLLNERTLSDINMHVQNLGTLNRRTGILMTKKIYTEEELAHKAAEKKKRAKSRRDAIRADVGEIGETAKQKRARIKKQANTAARAKIKLENRKAMLLASKEVTERTILGIPEGKGVRKMGKLSLAVLDRIAQLGFDPLEQSVNIARGTAFKEDHPFTNRFEMTLTDWCDTLGSFDELDLLEVERFKEEGLKILKNSFTPIDLRSKHTMELLTYLYPKRKSMEMSIEPTRGEMTVTPLTDDEVDLFNAKFMERY